MSTKSKLSLIIFTAVILSACTTKTPTGTDNNVVENQPTVAPTEQSQSNSLRDLLALGKNQKCVFSASTTDDKGIKTDTTGTIYFSGKNLAEDLTSTSTDKGTPTINMHMVSDGAYLYTWDQSAKTQGMKIKITEPEEDDTDKTKGKSPVDLDEKVNMNCSVWIVDNSKFTIPTDVKFTDIEELMKNIPTVPAIPGE